MVTIRDVARQSGCSSTTVSVVLNDAPLARSIPASTKVRIRRAAARLGYRPNQFARSLRSRRSYTVGVMVTDITDPYCSEILRGIESELYTAGYLPILTDIQNDGRRFQRYVNLLLDRRVEGLITQANSLLLKTDALTAFEERNIPTVIVGREEKRNSASWVAIDNESGSRAALQHLHKLGHRQIAYIRGPKMVVDSVRRWQGIQAFAAEAGLPLERRLVIDLKDPSSSFEGGYEATRRLLGRKMQFSSVVAFDDMTAFGSIRALTEAGLRVPDDCAVVGFDDIPAAAFYNPPLTTVRQGLEALGGLGVRMVLDAIAGVERGGKWEPRRQKVTPTLVVRQSTARRGD